MKSLSRFALVLSLAVGASLFAETKPAEPANPKLASYPLTTCVVSGEKLGEMGAPYEYVHKEEGKPDRVVFFCCKPCTKDFQKEPAKYLAMIDAAAAAKK
jgi:YHS domain-containing protein